MSSTGINRRTGKVLRGLDHVRQSLEVIFTTRIGSRVLRRSFGFGGLAILGRPFTPSTLLNFVAAVIMAVDLWEPRYRITRVSFPKPPNTMLEALQGHAAMVLDGIYRPNGHKGDFTGATAQQFVIGGPAAEATNG